MRLRLMVPSALLTSSANAAVAFTSASAAQAAPERLSPQIPSVVASTSNSSSPAATGNLQKTASTQFKLQPPLQQSSSGSDSRVSPPIAGRAIIPPDQHYHPAYQLQQFRQPELSQNLPPSDADSRNSTLLQMQIAGNRQALSQATCILEQPSADPKPQLGQYDVPSFQSSSNLQKIWSDVAGAACRSSKAIAVALFGAPNRSATACSVQF